MPALREMLDRFRLAGPPGPAAPAAVPADRRSMLLDEVAPVFAALSATVEQARDVVAAATAEADRVRAQGAVDAESILRAADEARPAEFAAAFAQARARATERATAQAATAEHTAQEISQRAAARRGAVLERAVDQARRAVVDAEGTTVP